MVQGDDVVLLCLSGSGRLTDLGAGFWSRRRMLVGPEPRIGRVLGLRLGRGSRLVRNPLVVAE